MSDKRPYYSKAHLQLTGNININIFEYRDPLVRPYVYRYYEKEDSINWQKHPGVEILGEGCENDPAPREFVLLKFKDDLHLLRAALICPELSSLDIKRQVWSESSVYYRRKFVNSAIESKRRYRYALKELEEFTKNPQGYVEEPAVQESITLKKMLASLRSSTPYYRKRFSIGSALPRHRMQAPVSGKKAAKITP